MKIFIIIFFFFNVNFFSQINNNYNRGFEIGFQEGYCYNKGISCLTPMKPLTPMPRINENQESYTDGYNRGFQYGLDLRRNNDAIRNNDILLNRKITSFNKYFLQNPTEQMRVVGIIKQKKYEARTEWLQQKIYYLTDLYNSLLREENFPAGFDSYTHKNNLRNVIVKYSDVIKAYDFSNDYIFQNVQNEFINIENYFYRYYNSLVSQINQKQEKIITSVSNSKKNEELKFTRILEKYYGKYNCIISVFELVNNSYILKENKNGFVELRNDVIYYGTEDFQSYRDFLYESLDEKAQQVSYKTDFGNVVIDYSFNKIFFYNLDNKEYYIYKIGNKN